MKELINKLSVLHKGELFGRVRFFIHKKTHKYDRFFKKNFSKSFCCEPINIFCNEKQLKENINPYVLNYCGKSFDVRDCSPLDNLNKWYLIKEKDYPGDVREFWEASRLQNINLVLSNYLVTKNNNLINDIDIFLINWFKSNPVDCGYNHISNLEIAIRFLVLYRVYYYLGKQLSVPLDNILYSYGIHLFYDLHRTNLCVPNNHSLGEAASLFLASKIFKRKDWEKYAKKTLLERFNLINEKGECLEESSGYHFFVTQMMILVLSITDEFDDIILDKIIKSINILQNISDNNGFVGKYGDCDDGLFYSFDSLERNNIKQLNLNFLVGGNKIQIQKSFNRPKNLVSNYVRTIEKDEWKVALIGGYEINHAHCQCLSILAWYKGEQFILSSGSYHYNGREEKTRLLLASSTYSNAPSIVTIDRNNFVTKFRHKKMIKSIAIDALSENALEGKMVIKNQTITRKVLIDDHTVIIEDSSSSSLSSFGMFVPHQNGHFEIKYNNDIIIPNQKQFSPEYGVIKEESFYLIPCDSGFSRVTIKK